MKAKTLKAPVQLGKTYTMDITGVGHSGEGVGKYQEFTVFVPCALPGEKVEALITEVKKNYARGKLIKINQPSEHRTVPRCEIYEACGGCQLQHISYDAQLALKTQRVADAIIRIGKLTGVTVHATIGTSNPYYYRNKMQFPVGMAKGRVAVGCFAQGTHEIINTDNCHIQHAVNNDIARVVREAVSRLGIPPYDEKTGKGVIRHVLGRVGTAGGEVMAVLVTATANLPHKEKIIEILRAEIRGLVSIVQNINPKTTNVVLGEETKTLWGKDTISDRLGDFVFQISAKSFFQVNTEQAKILYDKAVEYANLKGSETVIDAYCGTGTITLFMAQRAGKVIGIEVVEPAIKDAWKNAETNGVRNVEFIVGDSAEILPELYAKGLRPDVIVVDPPRAGCAPEVLKVFAQMSPQRIVYVSCNPASLARDLAILAESGYTVLEVQPVDMFPQTYHVECVALIERK